MKIDIEILPSILTEEGIDKNKQEKILEHIKQLIEEEKNNKEKVSRPKQELSVIILDELGEIKTDNVTALVCEVPPDFNHNDIIPNIKKAISEFNNTKKGQKNPVKSISESFQVVKPKLFKAQSIKKKCKEPIRCIVNNNKV